MTVLSKRALKVVAGPSFRPALTTLATAFVLSGCAGTAGLNLGALNGENAVEAKVDGEVAAATAGQETAKVPGKNAKAVAAAAAAGESKVAGDPKDVRVAFAEAKKLKAAGKVKEALAVLDKAGNAHPNHRGIAVERGLIALELGQSNVAQQHLSKTSPAEAKDWRALSGLGIAHASQGQQAEAQRYFKQALEIDPSNTTVMNNLAMSLILDRKVDEAEALLKKASQAGDAKPLVARNLALAQSLRVQQQQQAASSASPSATP